MWELDYKESWALKNWCFWTVVWRKLFRVHWTARWSNQSIVKEISPELEGEAETPVLWPPDVKNWLIGKDPVVGKIEDRRRWGRQRMRWLDGITDLMGKSLTKFWVLVINRETWHTAVHGSQSVRHNDWNELKRSNWYFVGYWILS